MFYFESAISFETNIFIFICVRKCGNEEGMAMVSWASAKSQFILVTVGGDSVS